MKCEYRKDKSGRNFLTALLLTASLLAAEPARAALPVSLDQVPVPEPANIGRFVKDRQAAIRLGKALFWDMQLGSDGGQACASCHFHAGTDNRVKNSLSPGLNGGDSTFQVRRPDTAVGAADFPFFKPSDPDFRPTDPANPGRSTVLRDANDVISSQGVALTQFQGVRSGQATDAGRTLRDGVFARDGRNVRRVPPRNTPSTINAVFNIANFWDGRANHFFNGVNPFGIMDTAARVFINRTGGLAEVALTGDLANNPFALNNASLASQAVGPPLSDMEMSWAGRTFPEIGRKLLTLTPLAKQRVHPTDSVLGSLAKPGGPGLTTTYGAMIRAAFQDEFWNSTATIGAKGLSQMEANFSLFFGLAVQLYEATLVSSDTPFDRFLRGNPAAMTERQLRGMNLFFSGGTLCSACHAGAELTASAVGQLLDPGEVGMIELMGNANGALANYDIGFYNIGVQPTTADIGRGGRVTLNGVEMPLSFTGQHFERARLPFTPLAQPGCANNFIADPPTICPPPNDPVSRIAVRGAFKTPGLRNIELTGPYMHNGGMATLMQVAEFYVRGGDFHEANIADLDPIIDGIGGMRGNAEAKAELVDFLLALTDDRVRWETAPFDHPQLFLPDGHENKIPGNPKRLRVHADKVREIPAVGAAGRQAQGLPPLKPFLADDLTGADLAGFHFRP